MINRSSVKVTGRVREKLTFKPLKKGQWKDFEKLFGTKGACGGCWCMYWRLKRSEFVTLKGDGNRKKMRSLVADEKIPPGIILYSGNEAVGWCALAPRGNYPVLNNSRILKPVDEEPVWSIVCFYIDQKYRRMGLTEILLRHAIEFGKKMGAKILEGYPVDVGTKNYPSVFAYTGIASAFLKAGFKEVARRSESRPIMRYYI